MPSGFDLIKRPLCDICHGSHGALTIKPCGHNICNNCWRDYRFESEPENQFACPYDNYKQFIRDCKAPFIETKKKKKQTTKLKRKLNT